MPQSNTYKYLTFAFGILALVFIVLYFTKPEPTAEEIYTDASAGVQECRDELAAWKVTYGAQGPSAAKQSALDDVLDNCRDSLIETSETLSE